MRCGSRKANMFGSSRSGGSIAPIATSSLTGADAHGFSCGSGPRGERDAAARAQDAARLAQRGGRVGEQHVAPARQDAVEVGRRQVDPLGVDRAELDVGDPELGGAGARLIDHLLDGVGADQRAAGLDQLGGEKARCRRARRRARARGGRAGGRSRRPSSARPARRRPGRRRDARPSRPPPAPSARGWSRGTARDRSAARALSGQTHVPPPRYFLTVKLSEPPFAAELPKAVVESTP